MIIRPYQSDAIREAIKENVIIVLPTGAGKTLIAVEVIKHFLAKYPNKFIIFSAPTNPLVDQQTKTLSDLVRFPDGSIPIINRIQSESCKWDHNKWRECQSSNILIGTPAVFFNAFSSIRAFSYHSISLMVVDECHNSIGNSPGANLLRDLMKTPGALPRILGLTASITTKGISSVERMIRNDRRCLELLFNAKIFAPEIPKEFQNLFLLKDYESICINHTPLEAKYESILFSRISKLYPRTDADYSKIAHQSIRVIQQLGLVAGSVYLTHTVALDINAAIQACNEAQTHSSHKMKIQQKELLSRAFTDPFSTFDQLPIPVVSPHLYSLIQLTCELYDSYLQKRNSVILERREKQNLSWNRTFENNINELELCKNMPEFRMLVFVEEVSLCSIIAAILSGEFAGLKMFWDDCLNKQLADEAVQLKQYQLNQNSNPYFESAFNANLQNSNFDYDIDLDNYTLDTNEIEDSELSCIKNDDITNKQVVNMSEFDFIDGIFTFPQQDANFHSSQAPSSKRFELIQRNYAATAQLEIPILSSYPISVAAYLRNPLVPADFSSLRAPPLRTILFPFARVNPQDHASAYEALRKSVLHSSIVHLANSAQACSKASNITDKKPLSYSLEADGSNSKLILALPVSGRSSMSNQSRESNLDKFRNGFVPLIVTTSALEEGIDVPNCNFVIRFSPLATLRSHIQGSGRARHKNARVFYLTSNHDEFERVRGVHDEICKDETLTPSESNQATFSSQVALQGLVFSPSDPTRQVHPYFHENNPLNLNSVTAKIDIFNGPILFYQYVQKILGSLLGSVPASAQETLTFDIGDIPNPGNHNSQRQYTYSNNINNFNNNNSNNNIEKKQYLAARAPSPNGWVIATREDVISMFGVHITYEKLTGQPQNKKLSQNDKWKRMLCLVCVIHLAQKGFIDPITNDPSSIACIGSIQNSDVLKEVNKIINSTRGVLSAPKGGGRPFTIENGQAIKGGSLRTMPVGMNNNFDLNSAINANNNSVLPTKTYVSILCEMCQKTGLVSTNPKEALEIITLANGTSFECKFKHPLTGKVFTATNSSKKRAYEDCAKKVLIASQSYALERGYQIPPDFLK